MLRPADPAPDDAQPAAYLYVREAGGAPVPLPLLEHAELAGHGIGAPLRLDQLRSAGGRTAGATATARPTRDNFFFRSIFHPRDSGYEAKAAGLLAEAEALGVIPR